MSDRVFKVEVPLICKHCGKASGAYEEENIELGDLLVTLNLATATHNERIAAQVIRQLHSETPTYDRT